MTPKLILILSIGSVAALSGSYLIGKKSVKPTTKIQYVDRYIEKTTKDKKKELNKEVVHNNKINKDKKGHVVVVIKKTKDGDVVTTRTIDYDNKTASDNNTDKKIASKTDTKITKDIEDDKKEIVKQSYQNKTGIDYSFLIGRSLNNPNYDYIGEIGVPIFNLFKLDAAYEYNTDSNNKIFVGATFNF